MSENGSVGSVPGELPDTAMMSGSDEGEPGEHLAHPPLDESDEAVLEALLEPGNSTGSAAEDSPQVVAAAEDDAPLPVEQPVTSDDPLDAQFREPGEG
jgi:hypothetical protein